ncbi:hypothetical protein V6259_17950 [Marinomonas sp. TI.3.20]|uniref:hypothetical protein n=1 Tax=Marinomonas sp. TI.3.20 TaxID=3121296 RepID=UPI00311E5F73
MQPIINYKTIEFFEEYVHFKSYQVTSKICDFEGTPIVVFSCSSEAALILQSEFGVDPICCYESDSNNAIPLSLLKAYCAISQKSEISFDDWYDIFKPNEINGDWMKYLSSTERKEFRDTPKEYVWSVLVSDGGFAVANGRHCVNLEGFAITKYPAPKFSIHVYDEDED